MSLTPGGDIRLTELDLSAQRESQLRDEIGAHEVLLDQKDSEIASLRARVKELEAGLAEVETLIGESRGVDGLHLNGDVAPWDEIRTGGEFERLAAFDRAVAALLKERGK